MNTNPQSYSESDIKKLSALKESEKKKKLLALKKRLEKDPYISDLEFLLGAFIEMYEPHLHEVVKKLSERGYTIEPSSGLGKNYVALDGYFTLDYSTKNVLEKHGVKLRENEGLRSLYFWSQKIDLEYIKEKWLTIVEILPDKGVLAKPASSASALEFRRKYTSKNPVLQRQRLFERLEYNVLTLMQKKVQERKQKNPKPTKIEIQMGAFVEEIEPQVVDAVIEFNKKGYATDRSGFANKIDQQMIEGDFKLTPQDEEKLKKLGVMVESNPTGYTKIVFSPKNADVKSIKGEWKKISAAIQSRKKQPDPTMTKRAREFRIQFA